MELRDQLQQTLGSAYAVERELPSGGMARIFVAEEIELGRKVVVKRDKQLVRGCGAGARLSIVTGMSHQGEVRSRPRLYLCRAIRYTTFAGSSF